ncbi:hypothetical protein GGI21_002282 [Coemansia aciculifera]|nr:hypothetical protein GGI21_002282 [Coemansia aciculifera]
MYSSSAAACPTTPGADVSSMSLQVPFDSDLTMARSDSGNISPGAKSPNLIKRSLTLDRWRRKDNNNVKKSQASSPISLASLMPNSSSNKVDSTPGPSSTLLKPNHQPSLSFDTSDSLGLGKPQLTASKSEPFKPDSSNPSVRSKFSVKLRHRPGLSKRGKAATQQLPEPPSVDDLVGAGRAAADTSTSKHVIPGAGKVKRLFSRRKSNYEHK